MRKIEFATAAIVLFGLTFAASAQERVLGVDISYWNCGTSSGGISQANWNTGFSTGNRKFVWIRATRGGTTGLGQTSGTPGGGSQETLSRRYDDPRFVQNITRAAASGMYAGPYHFARPDVAGNTGTDEANHFIQMAGAWMRPGYLMPTFDMEAGQNLGGDALAQFSIDFSDRIYAVMQIRPSIYINGSYSSTLQGATTARRNALAQPASVTPSMVGPAYPMLWSARYYAAGTDPNTIPVQTGNPKDNPSTLSWFFGPWDDYGNAQPWSFWQNSSIVSVPGFNAVDSTIDGNVSHGDIEYVRNYLVPAVWWNNNSGDWSTLANWNSGQTVVAPVPGPGQATPYTNGPLPIARLPGAAGSGSTSGQYDTVILERPNANITVTLSTGTHNVRKLYMREALNITGGLLTVNYNPVYRADNSSTVLHGGPVSAQFSGPVTLGGTGNLTVHTLQVDTAKAFTLSGGTLTFDKINLMPHSSIPGKIAVIGNVNLNPRANATATIARGAGSGSSGSIDLAGANRALTVGNGSSAIDLSVEIPFSNGALTKSGVGTMRVTAASSYAGGTTISAGTLLVNNTSGSGTGSGSVTVNGGALGGSGFISGAVTVNSGGTISPGASPGLIGTLTLSSSPTFNGTSLVEIKRDGISLLADKIVRSGGALNYDGTLVVSNIGSTLLGGEVFTIFSANSYSGAFVSTQLPALNSGLNWYLGNLVTNGTIKVNRSPVANPVTFTNNPTQVLEIPIASLTSNVTDADGNQIALTNFDPVTTNGITLVTSNAFILYTNDMSVADEFTFVVNDGHGGSATNKVQIVPSAMGRFAGQPSWSENAVTLHFAGLPGWTYYVERSTNLPVWLTISTNIAPANGLFDFTDDFNDLNEPPSTVFYRLRWTE